MASSNFSTVLSLALFLVLLSHANSANDISFNITTFNETNLILQGDATVSSIGNLQLTNDKSDSMGRAFYSAPIQIRDSTTGNVASFDTNFTINFGFHDVNSPYGLAFALVPVGSQPKRKGPFLGLFDKVEYDPKARTVAVAFLNYLYPSRNGRDVVIDVNSILPFRSHQQRRLRHVILERHVNVRITYNSSTMILAVHEFFPSTGQSYNVSTNVELEKNVDDWVSVGFSATSVTGETLGVLNWSFSSSLSDDTTSERSNIVLNQIL
uniref:Alpha-amylase inhibitor-like n=1 Tax=Phaseolus maculatus TaxID=34306 RepID=Q5W1J9_PHAMA|nr:alpha-amylase inhibitor-like precursor [Phaseolus maculatus]